MSMPNSLRQVHNAAHFIDSLNASGRACTHVDCVIYFPSPIRWLFNRPYILGMGFVRLRCYLLLGTLETALRLGAIEYHNDRT